MSHVCDKCGADRAGLPYLAAHLTVIFVVAATALWAYGIGEAWDVFRDARHVEPWWGVQAILAIVSATVGLVVGTVAFFILETVVSYCLEVRPSWSAVRRRLRGDGGNCRWCGCARRCGCAGAAARAGAPGKKEEAGGP